MTWAEAYEKFGYRSQKLACGVELAQIWTILDGQYEILEDKNVIIVPDNVEELIKEVPRASFGKRWDSYTCKYRIYTRSKWQEIFVEKKQAKEREEAQRKATIERDQKELKKLQDMKEKHCDIWWDKEKIKEKVGITITSPFAEYYWTMIQDKWKQKDWKYNLLIENNVYNQIAKDHYFYYSGYRFLGASFKNSAGYSAYIMGTYKDGEDVVVDKGGIYAILRNGNIVYIGMTSRSFEERWKEHRDIMLGNTPRPQGMILYDCIQPDDLVEFKALIRASDIKSDERITQRDIEAMELGLITMYRPIGNYQGVQGNYKFK